MARCAAQVAAKERLLAQAESALAAQRDASAAELDRLRAQGNEYAVSSEVLAERDAYLEDSSRKASEKLEQLSRREEELLAAHAEMKLQLNVLLSWHRPPPQRGRGRLAPVPQRGPLPRPPSGLPGLPRPPKRLRISGCKPPPKMVKFQPAALARAATEWAAADRGRRPERLRPVQVVTESDKI